MKRTTVMLPDDLALLVDRERRRRDVSAATVIREAVAAYFAEPAAPKRYSFIGIASSGGGGASAADLEEILDREWADWIEWDSGLKPRKPSGAADDPTVAGSDPALPLDLDAGDS
jgi:hypothetical protein